MNMVILIGYDVISRLQNVSCCVTHLNMYHTSVNKFNHHLNTSFK